MPEHLPAFSLGMSAEAGGGGRLSGTWNMAPTLPCSVIDWDNIIVPEDTVPSMQSITVEPIDTVTQLPESPSPASDKTFNSLVLEDFEVTSAAFLALQSSTVSFLWWLT